MPHFLVKDGDKITMYLMPDVTAELLARVANVEETLSNIQRDYSVGLSQVSVDVTKIASYVNQIQKAKHEQTEDMITMGQQMLELEANTRQSLEELKDSVNMLGEASQQADMELARLKTITQTYKLAGRLDDDAKSPTSPLVVSEHNAPEVLAKLWAAYAALKATSEARFVGIEAQQFAAGIPEMHVRIDGLERDLMALAKKEIVQNTNHEGRLRALEQTLTPGGAAKFAGKAVGFGAILPKD